MQVSIKPSDRSVSFVFSAVSHSFRDIFMLLQNIFPLQEFNSLRLLALLLYMPLISAFYSVKATAKLHETWQWRMTCCQLAALAEDRELSALSLSESQAKQLVLKLQLSQKQEKIKSAVTQVLPPLCSAATSNSQGGLQAFRRHADKFVLSRASLMLKGWERCRNAFRAEQWVNWT